MIGCPCACSGITALNPCMCMYVCVSVRVCVCVATSRGQIPDSIDWRIEQIIIKQLIIDLV